MHQTRWNHSPGCFKKLQIKYCNACQNYLEFLTKVKEFLEKISTQASLSSLNPPPLSQDKQCCDLRLNGWSLECDLFIQPNVMLSLTNQHCLIGGWDNVASRREKPKNQSSVATIYCKHCRLRVKRHKYKEILFLTT